MQTEWYLWLKENQCNSVALAITMKGVNPWEHYNCIDMWCTAKQANWHLMSTCPALGLSSRCCCTPCTSTLNNIGMLPEVHCSICSRICATYLQLNTYKPLTAGSGEGTVYQSIQWDAAFSSSEAAAAAAAAAMAAAAAAGQDGWAQYSLPSYQNGFPIVWGKFNGAFSFLQHKFTPTPNWGGTTWGQTHAQKFCFSHLEPLLLICSTPSSWNIKSNVIAMTHAMGGMCTLYADQPGPFSTSHKATVYSECH